MLKSYLKAICEIINLGDARGESYYSRIEEKDYYHLMR